MVEERSTKMKYKESNTIIEKNKLRSIKKILITAITIFISSNIFAQELNSDVYEYISKNIMADAHSVIMETTNEKYSADDIKIAGKFGEAQNPFTGKSFFRDYISYPYYAIRKVCSALDGEIIEITGLKNLEQNLGLGTSITIKTEDLEIQYFGYMRIDEKLKVGDKVKKGTYLSTMLGGGDNGMVLNIRMKYKGEIIDPSTWFPSYF